MWVVVKNYAPFLGTLNIWCRIILIRTQKGTIILTTTHVETNSFENLMYNKEHAAKALEEPFAYNAGASIIRIGCWGFHIMIIVI